MTLCCWNCGKSVDDVPLPISRHANCRHCFEVLHCCRMCRYYDTNRPGQCDHERAEPPVVKESANFCDYFKPTNRFERKSADAAAGARANLDALFGDEGTDDVPENNEPHDPDPEDSARSKLDDLFDD